MKRIRQGQRARTACASDATHIRPTPTRDLVKSPRVNGHVSVRIRFGLCRLFFVNACTLVEMFRRIHTHHLPAHATGIHVGIQHVVGAMTQVLLLGVESDRSVALAVVLPELLAIAAK